MERNSLSIRRRTTTGQNLPKDFVPKVVDFVQFCKNQRDRYEFPLSCIANMDETPIWADAPSNTTICKTVVKSVPIRTTGHEKNRITVCLAAKADGTKLRPYIVIPGKKVPRELEQMKSVVVASPNGWMNETLTLDWINRVWGNLVFGQKRFLVWDSFRCHISDQAKAAVARRNTIMGIIPGGCTKFLQPVDVSLNKPVKEGYRECYDEWFAEGVHELTKGGLMKAPAIKLQINWVLQVWNDLSADIIRKSFQTCGITTSDPTLIHCMKDGELAEDAASILRERMQEQEKQHDPDVVPEPEEDYDDDDEMQLQELNEAEKSDIVV